ncbi:MAG TPA: PspC domain-containing protein [Candidatus Saccharimonadales bacterium]|nr:PspC domain-containing protein [Candidatus Saccharimonadales bacterium]
MAETTKHLYRSRTDTVVSGVCAGIAEYLHVDPTIIRLAWIIVTILTGILPGVFVYLLAVALVPKKPDGDAPPQHPE